MDYDRFRFKAVVDWIEIEIVTASVTNFMAIQKSLRVALSLSADDREIRVDGMDERPGKAATTFRFKVQDPERWRDIAATLDVVAGYHPFARTPTVVGIEVAFDAYGRGVTTKEELAEQAVRFYRFCHPVSQNQRVYRTKKDKSEEVDFHIPSLVRRLLDGWQIGIGDKDADLYQHVYLKTTDKAGEVQLPESEHRARIEITLRGQALPYSDLNEWSCANFAKDFRSAFVFRRLKAREKINLYARDAVWNSTLQVGERKQRWRVNKGKTSGERLYSKVTKADSELNEKARDAFRELMRRWRTGKSSLCVYGMHP